MNIELVEKYIQFAIDNGFGFDKYIQGSIRRFKIMGTDVYFECNFSGKTTNIIELITSDEFIGAIVSGYINIEEKKYGQFIQDEMNTFKDYILRTTDDITIKQSIAIRNKNLEYFIKTIIN